MLRDPSRPNTPLSQGDDISLRLDSLAAGGEAVGRHDGLAVFVECGAPGDLARVRITHAAQRFARGTVEEVIEPGPQRVEPPCPYFGACGGCQWQHIAYDAQVRAKESILRDSFARIAGVTLEGIASAPMPEPWRYRGAAEYGVGQLGAPADLKAAAGEMDGTTNQRSGRSALGFLRMRSSEVIPIADCLVQHPLNAEIMRAVNEWLAANGGDSLRLVRTRTSFAEQRALVTLVFSQEDRAAQAMAEHVMRAVAGVAGVSALAARDRRDQHRRLSHHLAGEQFIFEEITGQRYRIGADTFFQVNAHQAARMVELVLQMAEVKPEETVLDGYCGAGIFLVPLAQRGDETVGVEANPSAVRDARANLRRAGLRNASVVHEKVERALPLMASQARSRIGAARAKANIIILDPPRQGCGRQVMNAVAALEPRAVVMVSCDPATLARDVAFLAEHGYRPRRSVMVDMFPQTWRVESVTLCIRE
jgi:23S rRNA (uracil1939-C5)-methyltransferase